MGGVRHRERSGQRSNGRPASGSALRISNQRGYTLVELILALIILGVLAAIATKSLTQTTIAARTETTIARMDRLACAIAGDPNLISGGARNDFGYVGDVGALPANLDQLVTSPGYSTWSGPYVRDEYSAGGAATSFKQDAWGTNLVYSAANGTITSNGSGTPLVRKIANDVSDLTANSVTLLVTDISSVPPGPSLKDSIRVYLTYPNGAGGYRTDSVSPNASGRAMFNSIPIGLSTSRVWFQRTNDTLTRELAVHPGSGTYAEVQHYRPFFSSSSLVEYLRPSATGALTECVPTPGTSQNWQCVAESTSDDDASYVKAGSNTKEDLYTMTNHALGSGLIDSVRVAIMVRDDGGANPRARTMLRTGGNNFSSSQINLSGVSSYTIYRTNYTNNPQSGSVWSWGNVDALEAGVMTSAGSRCTQVWVEVYYRP